MGGKRGLTGRGRSQGFIGCALRREVPDMPKDRGWKKRFPWWLNGKESACQCRRRGFDPWSGKISHVPAGRLSQSTTTAEPVLWSLEAAIIEPTCLYY